MASKEASQENAHCASLPQLSYVSTTIGMQDHPNSWHLASLTVCFLTSTAKAAAPTAALASFMMTEERTDVTVIIIIRIQGLQAKHKNTSEYVHMYYVRHL